MTDETVEVRIEGSARVEYCQTRVMPRKHYERLNARLHSPRRDERLRAESEIGGLWVDRNDVLDDEDFDLDFFGLEEDATK